MRKGLLFVLLFWHSLCFSSITIEFEGDFVFYEPDILLFLSEDKKKLLKLFFDEDTLIQTNHIRNFKFLKRKNKNNWEVRQDFAFPEEVSALYENNSQYLRGMLNVYNRLRKANRLSKSAKLKISYESEIKKILSISIPIGMEKNIPNPVAWLYGKAIKPNVDSMLTLQVSSHQKESYDNDGSPVPFLNQIYTVVEGNKDKQEFSQEFSVKLYDFIPIYNFIKKKPLLLTCYDTKSNDSEFMGVISSESHDQFQKALIGKTVEIQYVIGAYGLSEFPLVQQVDVVEPLESCKNAFKFLT